MCFTGNGDGLSGKSHGLYRVLLLHLLRWLGDFTSLVLICHMLEFLRYTLLKINELSTLATVMKLPESRTSIS